MQLAPRDPARPFVLAQPLPAKSGTAPTMSDVDWKQTPTNDDGLVSIRYEGTVDGAHRQFTVRPAGEGSGDFWQEVRGSLDDAVRAARELSVSDGYTDNPAAGSYARSSVAVLGASEGAWHLLRLKHYDGPNDGLAAIISMPIDRIPASKSEVSVPYGSLGVRNFDTPDAVSVRFDDPRVAAVVGIDSVAYAPHA